MAERIIRRAYEELKKGEVPFKDFIVVYTLPEVGEEIGFIPKGVKATTPNGKVRDIDQETVDVAFESTDNIKSRIDLLLAMKGKLKGANMSIGRRGYLSINPFEKTYEHDDTTEENLEKVRKAMAKLGLKDVNP